MPSTTLPPAPSKQYVLPLLSIGSALLFVLIYGSSLTTMAHIWWRSETYAHGMIVPIISIWLIFRRRQWLSQVKSSPCWWALPILAVASFVWLIGKAADLLVVEHIAATGVFLSLVLLLQGWKRVKLLLFPLSYLIFAVPFGEELTPWLQQVTADITVLALQVSGIPVYVNGLYIEIPSGRFEVAEACSGIRYLIASLAVGTLFGYLTFSSFKKRLIFGFAALAVPILANGIRAYLIVLIAHLSDMKYATGVDHLIYGWLFFGIVMLILFWLGSFWRDSDTSFTPRLHAEDKNGATGGTNVIAVPILAILLLGLTGLLEQRLTRNESDQLLPEYNLRFIESASNRADQWQPEFISADRYFSSSIRADASGPVSLYMADYLDETQDKELINAMNKFYPAPWVRADQRRVTRTVSNQAITFVEIEIRHPADKKRLVNYVYQVGDRFIHRGLETKFWQAIYRLGGQPKVSRVIVINTPFENYRDAQLRIDEFLWKHWADIQASQVREVESR